MIDKVISPLFLSSRIDHPRNIEHWLDVSDSKSIGYSLSNESLTSKIKKGNINLALNEKDRMTISKQLNGL